jgi:broad-specificity NMP kinase
MRIGISGTHGTGKTTLAEALAARLPGYVTADEPYYLLEEEGCEFGCTLDKEPELAAAVAGCLRPGAA